MISADVKPGVKQEIKELLAVSYHRSTLKYNVKQAYIFNLILIGIPSNVILTVINRGGGGFLLNSQNLLSMTKVIGWGSLRGWLLPLEFKICLKKLIPSPEMWKLHPIPGYNFSWYTEEQALVLFHVINS